MLKNKRLKEAIENVGMVNNIDGQNFEKDFVGTAPVSYADAVLRARKRKEACKKAYEDQVKVAREALKKEVSNEEHPEPLGKIRGRRDRKMTLDEGLFESFDDEHLGHGDDVCPKCGKNPCECKVEESYLKEASSHIIPVKNKRKIIIVEDEASIECILSTFINTTANAHRGGETYYQVFFKVISDSISPSFGITFFDKDNRQEDRQEEFYESVPKKFDSVSQFIDYLVDIYNSYPHTDAAYNIRNIAKALGCKDVDNIEESLIRYPNGKEVTDIDLDRALDYQYGTDRNKDNSKYTDDEKQKAVTYWLKKTDGFDPYEESMEEAESSDSNESDLKKSLESAGFKVKEFDKNEDGEVYAVVDMVGVLEYNPIVFDKTPECDYYTVNFEEYNYRELKCPKFEENYSNMDDVIALLNDLKNNFDRLTIKAGNYSKDVSELTIDDLETAYDKGDPNPVKVYDYKGNLIASSNDSVYNTVKQFYNTVMNRHTIDAYLSPYEVSKKKVEQLEESKEDARVFRVTYKHSPTVFSSVMVKAANEDEAKQKLAVKEPGKDIIGVSVMSSAEVSDMTNRGMSLMEAKVIDDFSSYEPWGAAVSTFDNIQNAGKMDALEQLIDDMYPDGINKTELNDLLAFESDWVYSMLVMPSEEDFDEEGEE